MRSLFGVDGNAPGVFRIGGYVRSADTAWKDMLKQSQRKEVLDSAPILPPVPVTPSGSDGKSCLYSCKSLRR
jgi:hypothetical protein